MRLPVAALAMAGAVVLAGFDTTPTGLFFAVSAFLIGTAHWYRRDASDEAAPGGRRTGPQDFFSEDAGPTDGTAERATPGGAWGAGAGSDPRAGDPTTRQI